MKDQIVTSVQYQSSSETRFIIDKDPTMEWIGSFESGAFDRFFIVIDEAVNRVWGDIIRDKIKRHKKATFICYVEASESSKSLGYYPKIIEFLESQQCTRYDLVVAIGGGIIIDLVSFAVSTYMRGLPFYIIATTLIGQVDASTAGKTCLNTAESKNLLGTFYYPLVVYNNVHFLATNGKRYWRQGMSEMFKYGLLHSRSLIENLLRYNRDPDQGLLVQLINQTIEARVAIRKKDALVSNLGHTFGHALEKYSGYRMLHGDAISAGTVAALHYSIRVGIISPAVVNEITQMMKDLGLNIYIDKTYEAGKWVRYMMRDKKSSSKDLNLVLICGIGLPFEVNGQLFYKTDPREVEEFLQEYIATYKYSVDDCLVRTDRDEIAY